jgi:hypothetical protein
MRRTGRRWPACCGCGVKASLDEIVAGLAVETGLTLAPMTLDRVLQQVAGPVPRAEGGDPEYFSGYLGGG